jgi:hypothetical protein
MAEIELKENERTKCEVWTRVMGYHRPVESFNKGKKSEFYARKCFTEEKAVAGLNKPDDFQMAAE